MAESFCKVPYIVDFFEFLFYTNNINKKTGTFL